MRDRDLARNQIVDVELRNVDHLARTVDQGHGVLITPNHSFHFDSYCLLRVSDRTYTPFYIMTAWQVFGVSTRWQQWVMQKNGCFSVNREGVDTESFKTAVDILQNRPHPLVIFPEGDIYHTNDHVTPFREGAAAIAMAAARKAERPVSAIPVALRAEYLDDPIPSVLKTLDELERRLLWTPNPDLPIIDRILRVASAALALKECEVLGSVQSGDLPHRIQSLLNEILVQHEKKYEIKNPGRLPSDRIAEIRRRIIGMQKNGPLSMTEQLRSQRDMDAMFFATQLYSYRGDYLITDPTPERIAETVDKLEEDLLKVTYPTVRAPRKVIVEFGPPNLVPSDKATSPSPADLSAQWQGQVQEILTRLAQHSTHS
jgi:1-acyl-sn-glycerol-3-phosphate acyltransferase